MAASSTTHAAPLGRSERKPTGKQVYKLCKLLLDAAGLDWPGTVAEASELIRGLEAAHEAEGGDDDIPF